MTEFTDNRMARRLVTLEPRVDATALVGRVLAHEPIRARRRPRRLLLTTVAAAFFLVATTIVTSYYAPAFAQAVADAPIAGGITGLMLRNAGLAGVPHRITAMGDTSSSAGYQMELVGGYADAGRTILFMRATPPARVVPAVGVGSELALTDQFGQSYRFIGAAQDMSTGENTFLFQPLRWPASAVGARLRLSFNRIEVGLPPSSNVVTGRWELSATLAADESRTMQLPAGGAIGEISVSFTRVVATPSAVLVDLDVDSGSLDLGRRIPDGLKGRSAFTMKLYDGAGREQQSLQGGGSSTGGPQHLSSIWLRDAPGRYELRIAYEGVGSLTRQIDVP